MLNTYIKNRGTTQTLVNNNNQKEFNQINWDADYDGQTANISFTSDTDGSKKHFDIKLDNEDLANILNIPSNSMPIDKRLQMDFNDSFRHEPKILQIEMPTHLKSPHLKSHHLKSHHLHPRRPSYLVEEPDEEEEEQSIEELLQSITPNSYLSSPLPEEELIAPISIADKTSNRFTLTPHKRHKRPKTHKTYKVYKKPKSSSTIKAAGIKKSKSKTKTRSRPKSKPYSLF
jgi:hypothetical protein